MVEELVVEEACRGQGIGTALLAELESRAIAEGWAEVTLAVVATDADAIRFYRRRGYTEEALLLERHAEPAQASRSG